MNKESNQRFYNSVIAELKSRSTGVEFRNVTYSNEQVDEICDLLSSRQYKLTEIIFDGHSFEDQAYAIPKIVQALITNPTVTKGLHLFRITPSPEVSAALGQLVEHNPKLEDLEVSTESRKYLDISPISDVLPINTTLSSLSIHATCGNQVPRLVSMLEPNQSLRVLSFGPTSPAQMTAAVSILCEKGSDLTRLRLCGDNINHYDLVMASVARLVRETRVERAIIIDCTPISDHQTLEDLMLALRFNTNITRLELSCVGFGKGNLNREIISRVTSRNRKFGPSKPYNTLVTNIISRLKDIYVEEVPVNLIDELDDSLNGFAYEDSKTGWFWVEKEVHHGWEQQDKVQAFSTAINNILSDVNLSTKVRQAAFEVLFCLNEEYSNNSAVNWASLFHCIDSSWKNYKELVTRILDKLELCSDTRDEETSNSIFDMMMLIKSDDPSKEKFIYDSKERIFVYFLRTTQCNPSHFYLLKRAIFNFISDGQMQSMEYNWLDAICKYQINTDLRIAMILRIRELYSKETDVDLDKLCKREYIRYLKEIAKEPRLRQLYAGRKVGKCIAKFSYDKHQSEYNECLRALSSYSYGDVRADELEKTTNEMQEHIRRRSVANRVLR